MKDGSLKGRYTKQNTFLTYQRFLQNLENYSDFNATILYCRKIAEKGNRIEFFNWSVDPFERHTFLNVFFGTFILWGGPYTCSQYLIHRALCLPTINKGRATLYINYIGQIIMVTLVAFIGLALYAFYKDCDPVLAGVVEKRDGVIPLFVLQQFSEKYPGLPGIFISCLFSGAISTLDSALHALASVTWEEVKGMNRFHGISDQKETLILRLLSVFFGCIATGLAFLCDNLGSLISAGGTLFGACMGPMFGYTLVSILVPFVNLKGSCFGLIVGQTVNIWLSLGSLFYGVKTPALELSATNCSMFNITDIASQNMTSTLEIPFHELERPFEFEDIFRMSYNIFPIVGMVLTMVLSVLGSLAAGGIASNGEDLEKHIHPLAWRLFGGKSLTVRVIRPKKETFDMEYINKEVQV